METKIINIDTRNRDKSKYPSESNFRFNLGSRIQNIISITLNSFEYPNTSYVFSEHRGTNRFTVNYDGSEYVFTVTDGNYTAEEIIDKINLFFSDNGLTPLSIGVNTNSGKVTFESDTNEFQLSFPKKDNYKSFGQLIGFVDEEYTSVGLSIVSENIINVIGEHYYFLKVNDLGSIIHQNRRYMCKVVINSPKFEVVYEDNSYYVSKEYKLPQPIDLMNLDIELVDYTGNNLRQNGTDFSFTLAFNVITNSILKNYKELTFYNSETAKLMLNEKMLAYYKKKLKEENVEHKNLFKSIYMDILKDQYKK